MKKYIFILGIPLFFIVSYLVLDHILYDGVKSKSIDEYGFQAEYFALDTTKNKPAIVLIGGGYSGEYWADQFARQGFVGLSLPYIGSDGLPKLPEEIALEYFETALNWLRNQPEVNPNKIIVMGASRNAEATLVIAASFPELISGAIAYAPSSVSWSNTVLPYNSDKIKPSWTYGGQGIPYVPMDKITGGSSEELDVLAYWYSGLKKDKYLETASIKVEKISGPVLLFSGKNDSVWPSAEMANRIEQRLDAKNFEFSVQNIQYENAGHLISRNPENDDDTSERMGKMTLNGKQHTYHFGGTQEGDNFAKKDAKIKVFAFLENL